jgi:hypothetical protein
MAVHKYLSVLVSDGTDRGREPAVCRVYRGAWGSEPGPDEDHIVVRADVTAADHTLILSTDGVSEVIADDCQ